MDLIDKIESIQYYSTLPFGEIYTESMYFDDIMCFNSRDKTMANNLMGGWNIVAPSSDYEFSFEIKQEYRHIIHQPKNNIILKYANKYILLQRISQVSVDLVTNHLDSYFNSRYNHGYTSTYRPTVYSNRTDNLRSDMTFKVTGCARNIVIQEININS